MKKIFEALEQDKIGAKNLLVELGFGASIDEVKRFESKISELHSKGLVGLDIRPMMEDCYEVVGYGLVYLKKDLIKHSEDIENIIKQLIK